MTEFIAATILLGSLSGIGIILFHKIPALIKLPSQGEFSLRKEIEKKIKENDIFQPLSLENFLQKLLRRSKILTLKTENKISGWLEQLQQKSNNHVTNSKDNYWRELKNSMRNPSQKEPKKEVKE